MLMDVGLKYPLKKYKALIHWFIPKHFYENQSELARGEAAVGVAIIAGVVTPFFAVLNYWLHFNKGAIAILISGLGMLSSPFILKISGRTFLSRETTTLSIYGLMLWLAYFLDGLYAPNICWFLLCPLIGTLLGGARAGIIWCVIISITMLLIFYLQRHHIGFPHTIIDHPGFLQFISVVGLFSLTFVLLLFFVTAKSEGMLKLEKALKIIHKLAIRDDLTGVYNRRHILQIVEEEKQRAIQYNAPFCISLFDIDHFKKINDEFGHAAGDEALKLLAEVIQKEIRPSDYFGRYGGEEFLLLLPNTSAELAVILLERIRDKVARSVFPAFSSAITFTVSIGITRYQVEEHAVDTIARADKALYAAKRSGRNKVICLDHDLNDQVDRQYSSPS